jgi:alkanesulfonate monooxygenase SsuD/methylene tetrahydromethanopterin reductase-like flavin-dependent oxidoreductase (luciferase family)
VILSVGLGAPDDRFFIFEDDPGRKIRAEMLDEGLEMLPLLWKEEGFTYEGKHFHAKKAEMMIPPPPIQQPRIPVWVVGLWPSTKSMSRVARWDGWLPNFASDTPGPAPHDPVKLAEAVAWLTEERAKHGLTMDGVDIVTEGTTEPGDEARATIETWQKAGATWWLEANWMLGADEMVETCRARLRAGPPRP